MLARPLFNRATCSAGTALALSVCMALVAPPIAAQTGQPSASAAKAQHIAVPSQPRIVASSGAQNDVTDFMLFNDSGVVIRVAWIDGAGVIQSNLEDLAPGDSWIIANGAATWESHWYSISIYDGFVCSFSPRQFARVRLSDLAFC